MVFLQSEDKSGLPTAQQAKEKKRKEKERLTWGPPEPAGGGQSEAKYREKGVNWGRWVSDSAR